MNKKHNVFFLAFIVIFSLVLLSSQMVMGINARFVSSDNADDEGRVAEFKVEVDVTDTNNIVKTAPCVMMPGSEEKLVIVITSSSEVSVKGTISVTTANNLPLTIENGNATFELNAGGDAYTTTVTIIWDSNDNDVKYSGEVDVLQVNVTVEQVD